MPMNKALQIITIQDTLKRRGYEADTIDLAAEVDETLTLGENMENIFKVFSIPQATTKAEYEAEKRRFNPQPVKQIPRRMTRSYHYSFSGGRGHVVSYSSKVGSP